MYVFTGVEVRFLELGRELFFLMNVLSADGRKVKCCFIWETLLPIVSALCHLVCCNSEISFGDKQQCNRSSKKRKAISGTGRGAQQDSKAPRFKHFVDNRSHIAAGMFQAACIFIN